MGPSGEAPIPILPEPQIWPTVVWCAALVVIVLVTVRHAAKRDRWPWLAGFVLATPVAIGAYWAVELVRPRRRSDGPPSS